MYKKYELSQQNKPKIFATQNRSRKIKIQQNNNHNSFHEQQSSVQNIKQNSVYEDPNNKLDARRVNRAKFQFEGQKNKQSQNEYQIKQAVKMNFFRQSARERQRQFHQQNHQYLRMFSVIANSATSMDKFRINGYRDGANSGNNKGQNKTSKSSQNYSIVHLQLYIELTSSLINYKFPVKDTYNIVPFKKQSIQFQCRHYLDPNYQFFVFQKNLNKIDQVRSNLKNVLEEGLTSQFKGTVIQTIGNLNYFEFLDLINIKNHSGKSKGIDYPKQILQIAHQAQVFELNSDQEQFYTKNQINIKQQQTDQRMVMCQQFDLQQTSPSVYFQVTQEYTLYKKYRQMQFKRLKVYDKDININTDIRNIISSQKIYLIQLLKQLDLYIQLAQHTADIHIMRQVYKQLKRKSQQFLRLLCDYTESKILKQYNIENYHQKIMVFIEKSIKYHKQVENLAIQVLQQFPILRIWYQIPPVLFGYSREKLHKKYYQLVGATIQYQEKIRDLDQERQLSIRRPGVKYPE